MTATEVPAGWVPRVGSYVQSMLNPENHGEVFEIEAMDDAWSIARFRNPEGRIVGYALTALRPSAPPSAAPEFYMTQPSELPETLPIGTHCKHGYSSTSALELRGTSAYWGDWSNGALDAWISASSIDWSLVPRAKNPEANGGVAKAADPYAEHRSRIQELVGGEANVSAATLKEESEAPRCRCGARLYNRWNDTCPVCGVTGKAIRAGVPPSDLDRLAARRAKQVGALLGEMSRPAVSTKRHPADWDSEDAEELFSTHGSGR